MRYRRLAVLLLLLLCGCEPARDALSRLWIAVIPKGLTHEFWQSIHRGAQRAAADLGQLGTPTEIVWDGPLKENDALEQIRIVDRRISTRVDGIVLAPQHSRTMVSPVARAVEQKVPVVIIDSGLDETGKGLFVRYVATNNFNGGRLAAQHLMRVLVDRDRKAAPRLILFRYAIGSESTEQREAGFLEGIAEEEKKRGLKVNWLSTDRYAGATRDTAAKEARPLLNRFRDEVDGIFAVNESAASGMLDVLRSLGLNQKVRLMGFDSSEPLLQAVRAGDVDGLILQDPYRMGYLGVWTLARYLKGEYVGKPGDFLGTGEYIITRDEHVPERNIFRVDSQETRELYDPEWQAKRDSARLRK
jgi:ribose transport system substrate-binding protein